MLKISISNCSLRSFSLLNLNLSLIWPIILSFILLTRTVILTYDQSNRFHWFSYGSLMLVVKMDIYEVDRNLFCFVLLVLLLLVSQQVVRANLTAKILSIFIRTPFRNFNPPFSIIYVHFCLMCAICFPFNTCFVTRCFDTHVWDYLYESDCAILRHFASGLTLWCQDNSESGTRLFVVVVVVVVRIRNAFFDENSATRFAYKNIFLVC